MSENHISISVEFSDSTITKFMSVMEKITEKEINCNAHLCAHDKHNNFPKKSENCKVPPFGGTSIADVAKDVKLICEKYSISPKKLIEYCTNYNNLL